jgi:hypothetical protein
MTNHIKQLVESKAWKRFFIALIGSAAILAGIALLVLPGPGLLVLAGGLAILATEFFWARRALRKARGAIARVRRKSGLRDRLRRARPLGRKHPKV